MVVHVMLFLQSVTVDSRAKIDSLKTSNKLLLTSHNLSCPRPSSATRHRCPSAPMAVPSTADLTALWHLLLLNTNPNCLFAVIAVFESLTSIMLTMPLTTYADFSTHSITEIEETRRNMKKIEASTLSSCQTSSYNWRLSVPVIFRKTLFAM